MTFTVTDNDGELPLKTNSHTATIAAEVWAETHWERLDRPNEIHACVSSYGGPPVHVVVTVRMQPVFYGRVVK